MAGLGTLLPQIAIPVALAFVALGVDTGALAAELFAESTVHYPARQKTQLHSGSFDAATQRTYVVYPGGIDGALSACSPYIVYYDHLTETWSAPQVIFSSPVVPDSHNYPQILIDDQGILHVFHSFHQDHKIRHARSLQPHDISSWSITDLPDSDGATYGAAYQSDQGDFYVFFRHRDNLGGEPDYEPEYYLKSSDGGATWVRQIVIDPILNHPTGNDGWGTVYTKSVHYRSAPVEGLDIVFGIHKNHNLFLDAHYYVFFDFVTNTVHAADGTNLGPSIERDEFESCCLLFDHGQTTPFYNIRTAVDVDATGQPAVFHNQQVGGVDGLKLRRFNGVAWSLTDLAALGSTFLDVEPYEVEVGTSQSDAVLYAIQYRRIAKRFTFVNDALANDEVLYQIPSNGYRLHHLTFIKNALPTLKGFFYHGLFGPWSSPTPSGTLISFASSAPATAVPTATTWGSLSLIATIIAVGRRTLRRTRKSNGPTA